MVVMCISITHSKKCAQLLTETGYRTCVSTTLKLFTPGSRNKRKFYSSPVPKLSNFRDKNTHCQGRTLLKPINSERNDREYWE